MKKKKTGDDYKASPTAIEKTCLSNSDAMKCVAAENQKLVLDHNEVALTSIFNLEVINHNRD